MFSHSVIACKCIDPGQPVFRLEQISELEVANIINSLKPSKAKDVYGLDTHFLKIHKDTSVCPITHIINLSIRSAVVPSGGLELKTSLESISVAHFRLLPSAWSAYSWTLQLYALQPVDLCDYSFWLSQGPRCVAQYFEFWNQSWIIHLKLKVAKLHF